MVKLLGGQYQFIQVLGSSDLGCTYLAADVRVSGHPKCVVKQHPLEKTNPRSLQIILNLLYQKAKILEGLAQYDGIPKILNYFNDRDAFYLVQEFIPGHPFSTEIQPGYCLPEPQGIYFLMEMLEILDFAHQRGTIHRSIKPSNIIRRHPDGKLLLVDFALVTEVATADSEIEAREDKNWLYIPLEQKMGQVQINSDLYALGMVVIQALTGLSAEDLAARKRAVETQYQDCSVFWTRSPQLKPGLREILSKMVHPDCSQRYPDAAAVLADLEALRHGQQVKKPKTKFTPLESRSKSRYAHKWWITGIGVLTFLAIALLAKVPQHLAVYYWLDRAQTAANSGDNAAAIATYTQVLQQQPDRAAIYFNRGVAYLGLADWQAALTDFTTAIALDPDDPQAYYQRGNVRFNLGDAEGAQGDYSKAIALNPDFAKAYVNRGSAYAALGQENAAIADYTAAININARFAAAYLNRCLSYSNIGDPENAIADCTTAINLRPNHPYSYQNRGLAHYRLQNWQRAIADFNIAIQLDSEDPEAYYNRGLTRAQIGDWSGAITDYSNAIERHPGHLLAYYDLGLAYQELGEITAARKNFQTAAEICLDVGKLDCYDDALYQIEQLEK
ncbi:MAG: tetratricopeptide repeat protein [Jaaginema sp. PMC 1079.18]|nr:tetratricopeptide repeat protein [Jaaginema sp. PMC 1080.18]MEC4851948.1 tetratricopeptide repeat protein [Jaaginema sp. PMC 1079.18]MEC4866460.1 tetratricopeptide repeat protein [Jaaginema sp. PMC 1078.18]